MRKLLLGTLSLAVAASLNATVLATVNGKNVTDADVKMLMGNMQGKITYETLPKETKERVLEQAIERSLLIDNAIKTGISKTVEYDQALKRVKQDIALEIWMKRQFDNIKISDSDAKKYYQNNGDKFMQPKKAKARHILLKTEADAQAVIKELNGLSGKALEDKFVELAKSKSTGPSAKSGGELGWFAENQMVKPFSEAAFALKKGEITKTPIKTQFGYHVILSEGQESSQKVDFEKAKEHIKNGLKMEQFKEKISTKAKDLRKKAKVVIK